MKKIILSIFMAIFSVNLSAETVEDATTIEVEETKSSVKKVSKSDKRRGKIEAKIAAINAMEGVEQKYKDEAIQFIRSMEELEGRLSKDAKKILHKARSGKHGKKSHDKHKGAANQNEDSSSDL